MLRSLSQKPPAAAAARAAAKPPPDVSRLLPAAVRSNAVSAALLFILFVFPQLFVFLCLLTFTTFYFVCWGVYAPLLICILVHADNSGTPFS